MRIIGLAEFGGPEVLRVSEIPTPEPGAGEVRIRVHAVAVNPTDTLFRSGALRERLRGRTPPFVPGMDAAGTIDAIGPQVEDRLGVGDRVVTVAVPAGPRGGSYADYLIAPAAAVVHAPAGADLPAAATLMMNALTARLALDALALAPGDTVLVTGAAGALGGYVVPLAVSDGLHVLADAAETDRGLVEGFGAHEIFVRGDDLAERVRRAHPDGVDGLVDGALLGELALPAVKDAGGVAIVRPGAPTAQRGITVYPIQVSLHTERTDLLTRLRDQAEDGTLALRVAQVLPAHDAARAHELLTGGGIRGRLVLDFTEDAAAR